jgi:hypothetical protein
MNVLPFACHERAAAAGEAPERIRALVGPIPSGQDSLLLIC